MRKPKIGLLPMYVELYDLTTPEVRPDIDRAHKKASDMLRSQGLEVIDVPVCRLENEFAAAILKMENEDVDAIVTLHLAYSPSLESEKVLARAKLPLIILDTTPDYTFDSHTDISAMMLNHGIHGVQDMCNLLRRNGKDYVVCAGHMEHSDVLKRVAVEARCAMVAREFKNARIGLIGEAFAGMGDFRVPEDELKEHFGIEIVHYDFNKGAERINAVEQSDIDAEYAFDKEYFEIDDNLPQAVYDRTVPTCLAVREWVKDEKLNGFSINFLETEGSPAGLPVMPFTECCRAMANGIGYAGEGDVLTSAFVAALLQAYPNTTFAEMFCPDWEHGSVYLSHMGEYNFAVADGKPVLKEKDFPFTSAENPTVAYRSMMPGKATFVNLAPFGGGRYALTLAGGEMLKISGENKMENSVNGWFKPDCELAYFLEQFSSFGATHHSALVYDVTPEELSLLAKYLNCECHII